MLRSRVLVLSPLLVAYFPRGKCDQDMVLHKEKINVGFQSVDAHVESGMIVGLGTGTTVAHALRRIAQKLENNTLVDIVVVPCSESTRKHCISSRIPTMSLAKVPKVDVFIEGVDEIDPNLTMVIGGSGSVLREKMMHACALKKVAICDESKVTKRLGPGFPLAVEIIPYSHEHTRKSLERLPTMVGTRAVLRRGSLTNNKADGIDVVVTDDGNFILDVFFDKPIANVQQMALELDALTGVVEHGLVPDPADFVIVGRRDETETIDAARCKLSHSQASWSDMPMKKPIEWSGVKNRRPLHFESSAEGVDNQ